MRRCAVQFRQDRILCIKRKTPCNNRGNFAMDVLPSFLALVDHSPATTSHQPHTHTRLPQPPACSGADFICVSGCTPVRAARTYLKCTRRRTQRLHRQAARQKRQRDSQTSFQISPSCIVSRASRGICVRLPGQSLTLSVM
jgi:hypothetical protein